MNETNHFLRFCGQLIFHPENTDWDSFSPEQKEEYCRMAERSGWGALFVRYLKNSLPEAFYGKFREAYQKESLTRLVEKKYLIKFYQFLEAEKIPFVPIKGADLAFRVYPDQALRPHGDWDILFRKEDCPRVLPLLRQQGWKTFSGIEDDKIPHHHHYESMYKECMKLEVHWTLPSSGNASAEEIWQETEGVTEYHRVLTPEMNLLLLSSHASAAHYTHLSPWKILLDAGMLLKHGSVDWEKVHHSADKWGLLRPDVLLHAWSEFFPDGMLPPLGSVQEQSVLIRKMFDLRKAAMKCSSYERSLAESKLGRLPWLKKRLAFYTLIGICRKYRLDQHQKGKILLCGLKDFFSKVFFFLTHSGKEKAELKTYYHYADKLEKSIKHEKK